MRGLLLDLDGVVYVGNEPVPGSAGMIAWLVREGFPYRYLTNTTSRPRQAIVEKLSGMGIPAATDMVLTPAVVASAWLRLNAIEHPALSSPTPPRRSSPSWTRSRTAPRGAPVRWSSATWVRVGLETLNRAFRC